MESALGDPMSVTGSALQILSLSEDVCRLVVTHSQILVPLLAGVAPVLRVTTPQQCEERIYSSIAVLLDECWQSRSRSSKD